MVNNENTHFVNYQYISQPLFNLHSGASSGKSEMVKDQNWTDLLSYLKPIYFAPLENSATMFFQVGD